MKKLVFLFILGLGLTSCSVESLDSTENLLTADAKLKAQSVVTIKAPEGVLCAGEELNFTVDVNTNSNFQIQQQDIDGEWVQVFLAPRGLSGTATFKVTLLEGDNYFRYTGNRGFEVYSQSFVGVNCKTCENLLTATLTCGDTKTASFTFTAKEAGSIVIQGGLTNGTSILDAKSNVLTQNTTHPSVLNSKSNVTRWEGDVAACQEVTITIEYSGGNGIGDWSAKRMVEGEEVVLGSTEEMECQ